MQTMPWDAPLWDLDLEDQNKETENNWLHLHLDHVVAASGPLGTVLFSPIPKPSSWASLPG